MMEQRIIVEPFKERMFCAGEDYFCAIDSRALLFYSQNLPESQYSKAKFIPTQKYFILESGDMVPYEELIEEGAKVFTKHRFLRNPKIRKAAFESSYFLSTEIGDEGENDVETLVQRCLDLWEDIGLDEIADFEEEIREVFEQMHNK